MFGLFKKKQQDKKPNVQFVDLDGNQLNEGDVVESLRYDLGRCTIGKDENGFYYESVESGKRVSWALMVDAATERQKVTKIIEE
jgi:hypothetical protein